MTFDDMQRAMEFIVEHQAQSEIHMARLEASLDKLGVNVAQLGADLKQEREQRIYHDQQFAQWIGKITDLMVLQSSRLDLQERENRVAREEHQRALELTFARLDHLLELLNRKIN
jgi:hypothetical protein